MATGYLPFMPPTAGSGLKAERTPLLPPIAFGYDAVPQNFRSISQRSRLRLLLCSALRLNWAKMLVAVASAIWCWRVRIKENQWLFTIGCAGLITALAVSMVLRNARGNDRRTRALQMISKLFAAFWAIYTFLPNETRRKVREPFLESFASIAHHISVVANGGQYWYSIMGLAPAFHNRSDDVDTSWLGRKLQGEQQDSGSDELECEAVLSPRLQLLSTLMLVDELEGRINDEEGGRTLQDRGYSWHHKAQMLESYDELITLVIPSVSRFQAAFHNFCVLLVAMMLPWAFPEKYLRRMSPPLGVGKENLSVGIFLLANTILVSLLLHIIDTLMEASENPFSQYMVQDQICMEDCVDVLKLSISGYEKRRQTAETNHEAFLDPQHAGSVHSAISINSAVCAEQRHKQVIL